MVNGKMPNFSLHPLEANFGRRSITYQNQITFISSGLLLYRRWLVFYHQWDLLVDLHRSICALYLAWLLLWSVNDRKWQAKVLRYLRPIGGMGQPAWFDSYTYPTRRKPSVVPYREMRSPQYGLGVTLSYKTAGDPIF